MGTSEGYQLVQRLGSGVSGHVYLAEDSRGRVVIRQFDSAAPPDSDAWRNARQHFLDAGHHLLELKHRHIVAVLEVIESAGEALVAMEYVPAESLKQVLSSRRMSRNEIETVLRQVAQALDFAHTRGIVHGDLKPSHIFLTPAGARVSDFAISPRAHPAGGMPRSLAHPYLSPEHWRNPAAMDARSDQYSLAVIAYQMYTGQSPYGADLSDVPAAILGATIRRPSQVDPALPSSIDAALLRALDRDPRRRFDLCADFVAALGATKTRPPVWKSAYAIPAAVLLAIVVLLIWWVPRRTHTAATKSTAGDHPFIEVFTASPDSVGRGRGASVTLRWSVRQADRITIDHGIGDVPASGSRTVSPAVTTSYEMIAARNGEVTSSKVNVSVMERGTIHSTSRAAQSAPPSGAGPAAAAAAVRAKRPTRIEVSGDKQTAKLIREVRPVYPPLAKQARISGDVVLSAVIARDGTILSLRVVSGHPFLVPASLDAVKQWVYQPTLLNGEPVEVMTSIDVRFNLK